MEKKTLDIRFAAINERIIDRCPENKVVTGNSNTYAYWGDNNRYPSFLFELYSKCSTLQSVINGYADYIIGNGVSSPILPRPNETQDWDEFITLVSGDYMIFGIAYIQVIRDKIGRVNSLHWLDSRYCRTDEDNNVVFYNPDFAKNYVRTNKQLVYPKFMKEAEFPASVLIIKTPFSRSTYGTPLWESAIKDVMVETAITEFHLSELDNGFNPSAIVNLCNGIPSDEQKDEIEKLFTKKFTGQQNAGRFILNFSNGKDNAATIEKLSTDDFDKRYDSLAKKTKENIYAALRANPQLFGNTIQSGLNDQDYMESFRIFNRTCIYPIQKRIIDGIDKVLGEKGSIVIKPFAISFDEEDDNVNNNEQTIVN